MPHGGGGHRQTNRKTTSSKSGPLKVTHKNNKNHNNNSNKNNNKKKPKNASLKNQIRSTLRLLQKDLPDEMRAAQQSKLEGLQKQQEDHDRLAAERKTFLRDRKIKFFERRKIDRKLRRLEKHQRGSLTPAEEEKIAEELTQLKEDLQYVRFFPKTEKYVPLFWGDDNAELVENRNNLRMQIKANLIAAAASGKDLEETGSEDDGPVDVSDDDFFVSTSSDEADADDELTDINARVQASSVSAEAVPGTSNVERSQMQKSARSMMPPPRPQKSSTHQTSFIKRPDYGTPWKTSNSGSTSYSSNRRVPDSQAGRSSNLRNNSSNRRVSDSQAAGQSSNLRSNSSNRRVSDSQAAGQSSNLSSNISSNSDAPKRKRKRRPKKKKQ